MDVEGTEQRSGPFFNVEKPNKSRVKVCNRNIRLRAVMGSVMAQLSRTKYKLQLTPVVNRFVLVLRARPQNPSITLVALP